MLLSIYFVKHGYKNFLFIIIIQTDILEEVHSALATLKATIAKNIPKEKEIPIRPGKPGSWKKNSLKRKKSLAAIPVKKRSSVSGLVKRVGSKKDMLMQASKVDITDKAVLGGNIVIDAIQCEGIIQVYTYSPHTHIPILNPVVLSIAYIYYKVFHITSLCFLRYNF